MKTPENIKKLILELEDTIWSLRDQESEIIYALKNQVGNIKINLLETFNKINNKEDESIYKHIFINVGGQNIPLTTESLRACCEERGIDWEECKKIIND